MKVLIINGSPRANGNTDIALREMEKVFAEEGVETKWLNIGTQMIHGCVACNACHRTGKCGFDDVVNRAADILRGCDGLVVGTPVYSELFPSLIGLSLLPSSHREAFQRLFVRTSSWLYPTFILLKGRSQGFASTTTD